MLFAVLICVTANAHSMASSKLPTVRYCDLISKADVYDGKRIRLNAEYNSGFEHSVFADSKCVKTWDARKLIWVEFEDSAFTGSDPDVLKRFKEAWYHQPIDDKGAVDVEKWQIQQWQNWYVRLTVVGVFRKAKVSTFGFGQQNAYPFMIAVSIIENVGVLNRK